MAHRQVRTLLTVDRVTGMDAAMLEVESPTMHMHVLGVLMVEPSATAGPLDLDRLTEVFAERLHLIAPFRRRMVAVPGGVDHPRWIEDPEFELAKHLHHRDLGPGAGRHDLERFVSTVAGTPLRRDRPLWETWLADGFEDGTAALVTKVHHALMDGGAGSQMMASLFDLEPEPPEPDLHEIPTWHGERSPDRNQLLREALPAALGRTARFPSVVARTVASLAGTARAVAVQPSSIAGIAPRTAFNGALSAEREVALRRCPLDDLKEVRRAFGTTINDVVLAATAFSLRAYSEARDELPDRPLVASVPVGTPRGATEGDLGNSTSNMMVSLPVDLDDPVDALLAIHADAGSAKAAQSALGPEILDQWVTLVPAAVLSAGALGYSNLRLGRLHPPLFNIIVSNVAGPPVPLYLAGCQVVATYALGPLIANTGLNLTVLSQTGDLDVGVIAAPNLVEDVSSIADGFIDGVAHLLDAARRAAGRTSPPAGPS